MNTRAEQIIKTYRLEKHIEGGHFSEVFTSADEKDGRSFAGSIFFLLDAGEVSHLHQIDCDEIWYYHEGCGMRLTVLLEGRREEYLLGKKLDNGERAMAIIPRGSIFGAENLENDGFTFVSCVTVPHFRYDGFRLVSADELRDNYLKFFDELGRLAEKS